MTRRRFLVCLSAAACAALPAQEKLEQPTPVTAPLVLETMHASVARQACRMFGSHAELPKPGAGAHFVLTMDEGGELVPSTAAGDVGYLKLRASPGALMDVFAERIDMVRAMARGSGTMALTGMGLKSRDAVKVMDAVLAFPKQIAVVQADVRANPDRLEDGVDVALELVPAAGSWFGSFVGDLHPGQRGAPVLRAPPALMSGVTSFDLAAVVPHFEPLMGILVALAGKGMEDAGTVAPLLRRSWSTYDGTGAFVWDADLGMRILSGLADPAALRALMKDADYLEVMKRLQFMATEVELEPEALRYRDLPVQKLLVEVDEERAAPMGPNPMFRDGKMTTWTCIAGDYQVAVLDPSSKQIEALVDAVLDGKVESVPLGGDRVMRMTMSFAAFMDAMSGGMLPPIELPERVDVDVASHGKSLSVRVVVR